MMEIQIAYAYAIAMSLSQAPAIVPQPIQPAPQTQGVTYYYTPQIWSNNYCPGNR